MCDMDNERTMDQLIKHEDGENTKETNTHLTSENLKFNDVDTLLSCINIWKKESEENNKLSKLEAYKNIQPNSILTNDMQQLNNVVEGLLKVTSLKAETVENVDDAEHGSQLIMDRNVISNLNFPIDLGYQSELISQKTKEDDILSDGSGDTRFGTDASDMSTIESKIQILVKNRFNTADLNMLDYKGKNMDPETGNNQYEVVSYSETENNDMNIVDFRRMDYENYNLRDLINVDDSEYEFRDVIGELIDNREHEQNQSEQNELKIQIGEGELSVKSDKEKKELVNDKPVENKDFYEELENEENPILCMSARQNPLITEGDILSYGKSESNLETLSSIQAENKKEENTLGSVKDVIVDAQMEKAVSNKEFDEPEKIRGVCYCKSDNSWTAWWTEKGKSRKKAFKLSLYGYEGARKKAIEHRLHIEELMPELKERRTKSSKRKLAEVSTPKGNTTNYSGGLYPQKNVRDYAEIVNGQKLLKEDGIFKGTRNKTKEKHETQGIYFGDNTWHAKCLDAQGNRVINSFQVASKLPFGAARSNAINAYASNSQNVNANINFNANPNSVNYYQSNANYNMSYHTSEPYKRRKYNQEKAASTRVEGTEYIKNLERKLEEEIDKYKVSTNQYIQLQRQVLKNIPTFSASNVFVQNIQELNLPISEEKKGQNEESLKQKGKLSSMHCQIKLEKSILEEIEKAVNKSLESMTNKQEQSIESDKQVTEVPLNKKESQETQPEKNYVSVDTLCISNENSEKQKSINIIPTYISGPQDTKLITFVILSS